MNTRSMTKLLTGVVVLLFTLSGGSAQAASSLWNSQRLLPLAAATATATVPPARPAAAAPPAPAAAAGAAVVAPANTSAAPTVSGGGSDSYLISRDRELRCESAETSIATNKAKFSLSAYQRAGQCWGSDDSYGESGIDDEYNEQAENDNCGGVLNSSCREENAGLTRSFQDEEKEAKDRIRDIKKDMIDAKKDLQQSQRDHKQKLNEIQDGIEDAGTNLKKNGEALLDKLEKENQAMDDDLRKAKNQLQAQYNEWDRIYVEMRDQFRAAEQGIQQATYKVEVACRIEAQARLDETNRRIKERTDGKIGKKFNRATTGLAGRKKREFAEYARLRQAQYAEAYKLCLDGKSPGGAAAAAEVKTAKDNFERAKLKLADQQAVIENQRRQIRQNYEEAAQSMSQSKKKYAEQIQRLTTQQYEAYQKALTRMGREYTTENENFQNDMNLYNERQAITYQEMSDAQTTQFTASMRVQCTRANGGAVSESAGARSVQRLEDAQSAYPSILAGCAKAKTNCSATEYENWADYCETIRNAGSGSTSRTRTNR